MLISDEYRQLQRQLHAAPKGYGGKGDKWAPAVIVVAREIAATSVLDYGCGQARLGMALRDNLAPIPVADYDPAIVGRDRPPASADLVVCTDVLEHIEPDCIEAVLDHLAALTEHVAFIVVSLVPAGKVLADGRNAHILLQPREWWTEQLGQRFNLLRTVACREHKEFAALWARKS